MWYQTRPEKVVARQFIEGDSRSLADWLLEFDLRVQRTDNEILILDRKRDVILQVQVGDWVVLKIDKANEETIPSVESSMIFPRKYEATDPPRSVLRMRDQPLYSDHAVHIKGGSNIQIGHGSTQINHF